MTDTFTPSPDSRRKKPNLRPVDDLARELDEPPMAARAKPGAKAPPPDDVPPPPADDPPRRRTDTRPQGEIWDGCPVKPLGRNGAYSYYLDIHGQMQAIGKHERMTIMQLFGSAIPKLCRAFPKMVKYPDTETFVAKKGEFHGDAAAMAMMMACSEKGLFDPEGAVRGVGAWVDDDGRLIYHTGDSLLMGDDVAEPTVHQGKIYPAFPPVPHPAAADAHKDPVPGILATLCTWQWTRADIDPQIALGMFGVQFLGGALAWRPNFWLNGGAGTGKSEFQRIFALLHGGDKGLVKAENATAASIANYLGQRTLPVMLDELEPDDMGSAREKSIIEIMRIASSGGRRIRSSPDQKVSETIIQATFMASSILIPGVLKSQDHQRLIILSLNPMPEGSRPPADRSDAWRARGAALKRLLIDRWPTWAERFELWRAGFGAVGIDRRNADNWATVMAMADMAQRAELPEPDLISGWATKVARWVLADMGEARTDCDEMLTHLTSQTYEPMKAKQAFTLALWLQAAAQRPGASRRLFGSETDGYLLDDAKRANAALRDIGLLVEGTPEQPVLFIANAQLFGLKKLFAGTVWASGVWRQSAIRVKDAQPSKASRYFAGVQTKGVQIPFASIPGLLALDGDMVPAPTPAADHYGPEVFA